MNKGFTLVELIVTITIIAVLSGVILFSVNQYIGKGKDSNISGSLAVLVPAGEVWYNSHDNSYQNFCDPGQNSVVENAILQMPKKSITDAYCYVGSDDLEDWTSVLNPAGLCCYVASDGNSWVACVREFTDCPGELCKAYCVDSRGMKKEISDSQCIGMGAGVTQCP